MQNPASANSHHFSALLSQLRSLYPDFTFLPDDVFHFSPPCTIYYAKASPYLDTQNCSLLLHELGHALLSHRDFSHSADLLRLEVAAWQRAKTLHQRFHVPWDEDFVQDRLDSYRNFLYSDTLCPRCQSTGFHLSSGKKSCPSCGHQW